MPDIRLKNQPFDLDFHPAEPVVFTGLLTGEVKAFRYDDTTGESSTSWSVRPSKRTARALSTQHDGQYVWVGGKAGGLYQLSTLDGSMQKERVAHENPINRVFCVNEQLVVTGDDDGVIKFWDPRQDEAIRSYSHHYDYISDFCYFDDKRQLVSTSGDGHLSVIDIRSNKSTPLAISEDQEDELLSIAPIKGETKCIVGTTLGVLSIWNRKSGWGDLATGSEDGMIRVTQILPTKFLGVVGSHGEYPIERLKVDRNNKWLGSVSHDECVKLTDVEDLFEDSEDEDMDEDDDGAGGGAGAGPPAQPAGGFYDDL